MMRGAQKQMIVVRTGDSRYFDEAYFVLRREVKAKRGTEREMLNEADRILRESELDPRPQRKKLPRGAIWFLLGILCGGLVAAILCLVIL